MSTLAVFIVLQLVEMFDVEVLLKGAAVIAFFQSMRLRC